jgi:phage tail sheath protein FI
MAIPPSPSVVVLENDNSIYTPNTDSSVVGVIGFARKGPVNKPTLITSQVNLLKTFGKPDSTLKGQALEGAIEILEATNQMYFVRATSGANYASALAPLAACPAVYIGGYTPNTNISSIYYKITDNAGATTVTSVVDLVSSTDFKTAKEIITNAFDPGVLSQQNVFAYADGNNVYLASRFAGSGATMQVSAVGMSFSSLNSSGDVSATGASNITVSGYTADVLDVAFKAVYPGTGYNLTTLRNGSTQGLSVEVNALSTRDQVVVNEDGGQVESFNSVQLSPSSIESIEYILNTDEATNQSDYVYAEIVSSISASYDPPDDFGAKLSTASKFVGNGEVENAATPRFVRPLEGTYTFAGGTDGDGSVESIIGSPALKSGIYALDDDLLNISLAIAPGIHEDSVQNALISLGETSKNFLTLVSPPYGLASPQDAINWINGASQNERAAALNSSYAACYWPHVQVFNPFAGADEWYDPAIFAARQCVFTDSVSEPWFAPAGQRRGNLTKPTDTEIRLNQGDKDALYSNSINPVINDRTTGVTIFGQRTTQRSPTALDRVNVRRLMIFVRKALLELGKPFQFEPNDEFTWELVEDAINPFISDLIARRGILEGNVQCDSTTNTPARVDRNELWCSVTIKPTKAAETIVFEVNLTSQSATLN